MSTAPAWIATKDRLPQYDEFPVWNVAPGVRVQLAFHLSGMYVGPVHWMPAQIPPPPPQLREPSQKPLNKMRRGSSNAMMIFSIGVAMVGIIIATIFTDYIEAKRAKISSQASPSVSQNVPAELGATREESALLYAIGQVESGSDYSAVSPDSQHFGKYQMSGGLLLGLWGQPQLTPDVQDALALCHLRHLELKDGSGFHPEELAALWRGSYDADYRQRVLNLYNSQLNNP